MSRKRWRWASRWVVLVACVVGWQLWTSAARSSFFPAPSAIVDRMYQLWFSGPAAHVFLTADATGNILPSLGRVFAGLAIATAIGVPLGIALGRSPAATVYLNPLLQFARALPVVTMAPVFIVLFKLGTQMEIATIVFGTVWPILLNTIDGAASVDPVQLETARAFKMPRWERVVWVIVPAALPKAFAGFRLSLSLSLILMVFAELVGSSDGIGYEMSNASNSFDMTFLWATIVLLGILGFLLNELLGGAERLVLGWHTTNRRD
ncbi:MAG TPA: ABC transporter permease [Trebonia sp.]|jgi:ABC-type nitrate/sulfonate/bicarbonate transport system permease component|nr:ABC transporter permease [Trebonia sp.]